HVYTVQKKAWMDKRVWAFFLRVLLQAYISEPSVLLVDNLECHFPQHLRKLLQAS
ncbi:hypothetical protein F443_23154, partial [Phytophthora nicotianae P1569]